jgi:hypothetical protein
VKTYTIFYKSGHKVRVRTSELSITAYLAGNKEMSWSKDIEPKPLLVNVDHVESIWEGKL